MKAAVLWDLDGTLVDSEEHHWRAWREIMSGEGLALTRKQFLSTFGQRNDSILRQWLGSEMEPERLERIGDAKERAYRQMVRQHGLTPLPGATEWVKRLASEDWAQAVASSAPRANVEVVVEALKLTPYFQALVSAEDVSKGKPDPEVFLTAAARLNAAPVRSIVVEDAAAGVEAARRAGMRSIGVTRKGTLLPADLVVASLADLPSDAFVKLLAGPSLKRPTS
jgi:beta-phosphoglucomutase